MDVHEQAAVLALVARAEQPWPHTADLIEDAGSALRVIRGDLDGLEWFDPAEGAALGSRVAPELLERYARLIGSLAADGTLLTTVLDPGYPANLRLVEDRPPFLFIRGRFTAEDDRAVAVAGAATGPATSAGLELARAFGAKLARQGVAVVAAIDHGVGPAALTAALDVGGRVIAVLGSGVNTSSSELLDRAAGCGAVVSPAWPDAPVGAAGGPARDTVVSGLALGTVMVEAGRGDRPGPQALACLGADAPLFIPRVLTGRARWPARYAGHPGSIVVDEPEDITARLPGATLPLELAAG
jgi:DNA processing protein